MRSRKTTPAAISKRNTSVARRHRFLLSKYPSPLVLICKRTQLVRARVLTHPLQRKGILNLDEAQLILERGRDMASKLTPRICHALCTAHLR
jgi:hypothetical protein